jgi:mRNA interferase MazF
VRRAEVWDTASDGPRVLVVSINETAEFGAAVVLVLHPAGQYPDTVLSVELKHPAPASVFALNLAQMRAGRFDPAAGARRLGSIDEADMGRVEEALRAVLGL